MTDRRQFLTGLPAAAAAGLAVGFTTTPGSSAERAAAERAAATAARAARSAADFPAPGPLDAPVVCNPVASGGVIDTARRDAFPHVLMTNQNGLGMPFYEGYIRDRVVMMHFMSIREEAHFPATKFVSDVVAELGDRVGREVHVYSITRDPGHDTPARLAAFAQSFGAPAGWQFLTSSREHCADLAFRMYRMGHSALPSATRKIDVVFYGNGGIGLWGAFPTGIRPDDAAGRIAWVMPGRPGATDRPRRAGPRVFERRSPQNHNREI